MEIIWFKKEIIYLFCTVSIIGWWLTRWFVFGVQYFAKHVNFDYHNSMNSIMQYGRSSSIRKFLKFTRQSLLIIFFDWNWPYIIVCYIFFVDLFVKIPKAAFIDKIQWLKIKSHHLPKYHKLSTALTYVW